MRIAARAITGIALLVCTTTSCATTGAAGGALRSRGMSSDDRVVVRRHTDVLAVSASTRHVFALTTSGLLAFDRVFSRWRAPSSRVDEDLELAGVARARNVVLAADPIEDAVWVGVPGAVVLYRTQSEQVQRITIVGQPDVIAFARGDADAFVRASGQWLRVSRAGFVTPLSGGIGDLALVMPPQLGDVYRQYPALRGQLPFLLRDDASAAGGFASVTTGTLSPDQTSEAWIGTRAEGLWRVDANFQRAERLRYGVIDDMIGGVAAVRSGVWTGGRGMIRGGGLSFVGQDLQQFRAIGEGATNVFAGLRTTTMAVRASNVWVGSDRGVVRVRVGAATTAVTGAGGDATASVASGVTQWGVLHGLPSDFVSAVVPRDEGAWVATSRGVIFVHDTSRNTSVRGEVMPGALVGERVSALVLVADTLLIGTNDGLYAVSARVPSPEIVRAEPRRLLSALAPFRRPVQSLAWSDSVLLVVTDQRAHVLLRSAAMRSTTTADSVSTAALWQQAPIPDHELAGIGAVVASAVDARSVWIAGVRGVLAFSRDAGVLRVMYAGQELPADVTALALDDEWAWVGTNNGLVRVRRAREGGLP